MFMYTQYLLVMFTIYNLPIITLCFNTVYTADCLAFPHQLNKINIMRIKKYSLKNNFVKRENICGCLLLRVAGLFISPWPLVLIIRISYPRNVTNPSPVLAVTGQIQPFSPWPGVHSLRGRREGEGETQKHGQR